VARARLDEAHARAARAHVAGDRLAAGGGGQNGASIPPNRRERGRSQRGGAASGTKSETRLLLDTTSAGRRRRGGVRPETRDDPATILELPSGARYELLERIGAGGNGVVYRARELDGAYCRDVCIKRLTLLGFDATRELREEARLLARVRHANVASAPGDGEGAERRSVPRPRAGARPEPARVVRAWRWPRASRRRTPTWPIGSRCTSSAASCARSGRCSGRFPGSSTATSRPPTFSFQTKVR